MSEESRYRLHHRLEDVLGPVEATTLMEHLPAAGGGDLVTRDVLAREFALFRAEFAAFRSEIRAEFGEFRSEIRAEFAEFRSAIRDEVRTQTRTLLLSLLALQISAAGLVVGVAHLL